MKHVQVIEDYLNDPFLVVLYEKKLFWWRMEVFCVMRRPFYEEIHERAWAPNRATVIRRVAHLHHLSNQTDIGKPFRIAFLKEAIKKALKKSMWDPFEWN
jgi:hypothetical protein